MNNNMKIKQIIIALCLLATTQLNSQTDYRSFRVVSTGTVSEINITKYEMAISTANLESYRLETKSNILVFDSGVKIELKSAKECYLLGVKIEPSAYDDYRDPTYTDPTFHMVDPSVANGVQATGQKPYLIALYKRIEK